MDFSLYIIFLILIINSRGKNNDLEWFSFSGYKVSEKFSVLYF